MSVKILYREIRTETEKTKYKMMKKMVNSLILKGDIDLLPAYKNKTAGIYGSNEFGGKKFWDFKELTNYFRKRTNEVCRIKL